MPGLLWLSGKLENHGDVRFLRKATTAWLRGAGLRRNWFLGAFVSLWNQWLEKPFSQTSDSGRVPDTFARGWNAYRPLNLQVVAGIEGVRSSDSDAPFGVALRNSSPQRFPQRLQWVAGTCFFCCARKSLMAQLAKSIDSRMRD